MALSDTIWNHMSGMDSGVGVAGSNYTHYVYPGIYQYQDFHHCGLEPNDEIVNYDNAVEVQTCQLDHLAEFVFFHRSLVHSVDLYFSASRRRLSMCVGGWPSTATTCCLLALTGCAWMLPNVIIFTKSANIC